MQSVSMNRNGVRQSAEGEELVKSADVPAAPPPADRIAQLFRHSLRQRRVHPLQHLLQRYRAGERA
jgi:hypothetical protein